MFKLRNISIKNKLVLMQVFTSVLVLGFGIAAFVALSIRQYKSRKVISTTTIANILGSNSISALEFLDNKAANKILSELKVQDDVVNATILDKKGAIFAAYTKAGSDSAFRFSVPAEDGKYILFTNEYLFAYNRIQKNNETLGWVCIRFELSQLNEIKIRILTLGVVLLLFGTGLAFLIAILIQRYISKPLLSLVTVTQKVKDSADYRIRAAFEGKDEIGTLSREFNNMLSTIEKRDTELAQSKQQLDQQNTLLNAVLQNMGSGLAVIDKTGKFIIWNANSEKIIGMGPQDIPQEKWAETYGFFLSDTQTLFNSKELPFAKALNGEQSDNVEMFVRNHNVPDGRFISVTTRSLKDNSGTVTGATALFHDVTESKKAELALKQSQQQLSSIYDTVGDSIFVLAVEKNESYRFISVNKTFLRITGLSYEQVVGKRVHEIIKQPSLGMALNKYKEAIDGKKIMRWEEASDYPAGRLIGEVSIAPVFNKAGVCTTLIGAVHDITNRVKSEDEIKKLNDELEKSLAIMRATLESTTDAILVVDGTGKISGFNQNFVNLWNLPDSILATKDDKQAIAFVLDQLKSPEVFANKVKELYAAPKLESFDVLEFKDGRTIERYSKPQFTKEGIIGRVWSFRDVTERKRAMEEIKKLNAELEQKVRERTTQLSEANENLRKSEKKYRKMVEEVGDVVYTTNYKGYFTYINPACEKLTGYTQNEILGKHFLELISPEWKDRVEKFYREQFINKITETLFSLPILTKSGEQKWVEQTVMQVKEGDRVTEQRAIVRDITERKKAEDELQLKSEQLEKNNILLESANKELEAFSYSVSHDLRAPIRAITGFTKIIETRYSKQLDEDGKGLIKTVLEETVRMNRLIDDILAFSRSGKKEIEKAIVDMAAIAKEAVDEAQKGAGEKYKAKITIRDLPSVYGDSILLKQVFINLVSNALKFSKLKTEPVIEIDSYKEANSIVYFIKDNGAGFNMKYYDKLFGVFQRLHSEETFKGTGIGLAIIKRIITRLGGKVWAEGKVDEGATFYFSLPDEKQTINNTPETKI